MPPAFSVVIATYNQAEYLRAALKSVLDQSLRDFEVIIVNNYSTDHTLDVIAEANDARVKVINFRNNGVIGAGRNVGIKASQSPYVAFLDSDDTWYLNKLERTAEVIAADPEVGLVCHDQALIRDRRVAGLTRRTHYGPPPGFCGNLYDYILLVANGPSTSASVVKRRYLDEVGYFSEDPALVTVEDYDLWLRLSRICRFHFIREVLGVHHFHLDSASANIELHLRNALALLDKHFEEARSAQRSYSRMVIRRKYASAFFGPARQYQARGVFGKSLSYYAKTLWTFPFYMRACAGLVLFLAESLLELIPKFLTGRPRSSRG
jgi:glycosyltransferase involved in cell wall biosynthesis